MRQISRSPGRCFVVKRRLTEGVYASQLLAYDELMNRLRTFVGDDTLEIKHMADRYVLGADAGATKNVAGISGDVNRRPTVVPFGE